MEITRIERRNLGINLSDGLADVCVWAPHKKRVALTIKNKAQEIALDKDEFGIWTTRTDQLQAGDGYKFRLDDDGEFPDPASLSQPEDVHGFSEVIDLNAYSWRDENWKTPPLEDYVIYELHVGTFTLEGTFKGVRKKLDYLQDLGVNAIEIMPVAQFPGDRNWGYDGVFPYAVQHSYGGALAFQQLIDDCHVRGIAVILDVVYNHLGPDGNYLGVYGPYFTDKYQTPWGEAINVDDAYSDGVRQYIIENMLMWLRDFHIDALRLDAVHAIKDFGVKPILRVMREELDRLSKHSKREYFLIAECDLNDPKYINDPIVGGYGMHAQWIDEFHHALRVSAGEPAIGYYSDFDGIDNLAKSYRDAYIYDGQYSKHRHKLFGAKATDNVGAQFVVFSQNHDQVGNRMLGERSSQLYSFEMQKLLAGAVMVAPYIPMLFMGEEYAEKNPFLYFVSHTDEQLAKAVREGRRNEFKDFHGDEEAPDPNIEETFKQSKLNWALVEKGGHAHMLAYYKALIKLRKEQPALNKLDRKTIQVTSSAKEKTIVLQRGGDNQVLIFMNFSEHPTPIQFQRCNTNLKKLFSSADDMWLGPGNLPDTLHSEVFSAPASSISLYSK